MMYVCQQLAGLGENAPKDIEIPKLLHIELTRVRSYKLRQLDCIPANICGEIHILQECISH
jgi:hypothetical protein